MNGCKRRRKVMTMMTQRAQSTGSATILQRQLAACASNPQQILFLDIETTGLSHHHDQITIIGWSFDGKAKTIVGDSDDPGTLLADAERARTLVTFNGKRFDMKFIARDFPEIAFPSAHVDLMHLCRQVGLTGGQKAIEKKLEITFRHGETDMDGASAVRLWYKYLAGDLDALCNLVLYNRVDIAAMGAILDEAAARLAPKFGLALETGFFRRWSAPSGWQILPDFAASAQRRRVQR